MFVVCCWLFSVRDLMVVLRCSLFVVCGLLFVILFVSCVVRCLWLCVICRMLIVA